MITIIGAGKVGGDAAMFCALRSLGDVLLLDIVDGLPRGEAMDINQMLSERGLDSTWVPDAKCSRIASKCDKTYSTLRHRPLMSLDP